MLFREVQDSPWLIIFTVVFAVMIISVVRGGREAEDYRKPPILWRRLLIFTICLLGCLFGMTAALYQLVSQNNASFSKQLMDEYHATSSRSFSYIEADSKPSNGATTVLTRDGKDTQVFIQIIKRDGKEITMTFHVLDDNSLYPKSSE